MTGYVTPPAAAVNKAMVEFLPELDSEYATYPMHHKRWYRANEKGPKGEPCFIKHQGDPATVPVKKDYAYCTDAPNGNGYYSLMCRTSYVNLYYKLKSLAPQATCGGGCFANQATRDTLDRYDDCKRVVYMRQKCIPKPDDKLASDLVMSNAQDSAKRVYNATQNEALIVNAVF